MRTLIRDKVRFAVGCSIAAIVWAFYIVRLTGGVGPMHDRDGNQAPESHYLLGAFLVTGVVATWIALRATVERRDKRQ